MLSICGSIYMNGNLVPFVRSVLDNAGNPDEIEFCVVEDESGSDLMAEVFEKVRSMTPRLKVIPVAKDKRIAYFADCISFYERESIFPSDLILELQRRLIRYESGEIPRIWFPPARNYDLSIEASSGDVILNTPLDLVCTFDVSEAYRRFVGTAEPGKPRSLLFGLKGGNIVRHHGSRLFDRSLFDALKRKDPRYSKKPFCFDERWFVNSFFEDDWNARARNMGAVSRGWEEVFGERRFFVMIESPWFPEYLAENMVREHGTFVEFILEYLDR